MKSLIFITSRLVVDRQRRRIIGRDDHDRHRSYTISNSNSTMGVNNNTFAAAEAARLLVPRSDRWTKPKPP